MSHELVPVRRSSSMAPTLKSETAMYSQHANIAYSLLSHAACDPGALDKDSALQRQLYVDATAYLLRGLPADLTEDEVSKLQSASSNQSSELDCSRRAQLAIEGPASSPTNADPKLLHRVAAFLTVRIVLVIALFWTWTQYLCCQLYQYDRQSKLSEWAIARALMLLNLLYTCFVDMANNAWTLNEGEAGGRMKRLLGSTMSGITTGVMEGVDEGVRHLQKPGAGGSHSSHSLLR